ncbi:MAG TPA: META domain-containing protein, partial [Acidimicrobiia bacterium]
AQLTDHVTAIQGSWVLESFTENGEQTEVEVDVNTAELPVLTFDGYISGTVGCNQIESSFETPYRVVDRTLTFGDVVIEASECGSRLMTAENALMQIALWGAEPIHLTIVDDLMIWEVDRSSFRFGRIP